jgi:hypothetical protein
VVPVTAKLSKKFYETLGEDVTNELVEWFNSVDATYRTGLRELNETNFTRFDARLGERLAAVDARFTALDAKLEQRLAQGLAGVETRLVRWMVGLWATALLAMIGLSNPR